MFVLTDGAAGMESVIAAKPLAAAAPVAWFSNDREFLAQSYRLNTAYFAEKPIGTENVLMALKCCKVA